MSKIHLTLACWDYDRTRPLQDGTVQVEGVDLTYLPLRVEETFWRMLRYQEFDAAELSMGSYLMARDKGSPRLIAIPVFPSRAFRHSCIYINTGSRIKEPKDLVGKRVGVPEYQITMAIWARGILQHEYGVQPEKMKWFRVERSIQAARIKSNTSCRKISTSDRLGRIRPSHPCWSRER